MREILFRGKRIYNDKWVEGYFGKYFDGYEEVICIALPTNKTPVGSLRYEVDPATIGQYTGLTDKNGVKIFEGDLITTNWWHGHNAKVIFNDGAFRVYGVPLFSWVSNETYAVTIVGNMWDNPELLEGE